MRFEGSRRERPQRTNDQASKPGIRRSPQKQSPLPERQLAPKSSSSGIRPQPDLRPRPGLPYESKVRGGQRLGTDPATRLNRSRPDPLSCGARCRRRDGASPGLGASAAGRGPPRATSRKERRARWKEDADAAVSWWHEFEPGLLKIRTTRSDEMSSRPPAADVPVRKDRFPASGASSARFHHGLNPPSRQTDRRATTIRTPGRRWPWLSIAGASHP